MGAFFVGEAIFEVVVNVVLLGAALFLTGAFLGAENIFEANLYVPQRITTEMINSIFRL